jgi:Fur family peroxide stress response transcriptional regulator
MQKSDITPHLEDFFTKCRQNGLRITPQRIAIFKQLKKCTDHPTADILYQRIRPQNSTISFDTVNRTLLTFANIGIVDIIESHTHARRFDPNLENHHHIHCIRCNVIIDFVDDLYESLLISDKVGEDNTIISKRVIINVICPDCKKNRLLFNRPMRKTKRENEK